MATGIKPFTMTCTNFARTQSVTKLAVVLVFTFYLFSTFLQETGYMCGDSSLTRPSLQVMTVHFLFIFTLWQMIGLF